MNPTAHLGAPAPNTPCNNKPSEAQAQRIEELEQRLAQRTHLLNETLQTLAAETGRRETLQSSLIKAQRFESIGRLAGGLAHDMANVLMGLSLGFKLLERISQDERARKVVATGQRAIDDGKGLIANLRSFTSSRADPPARIDTAAWLAAQEVFLGGAAGPRIAFGLNIAPDAWPVQAEEHRLSAALTHLALNARNAMPDGGELTLALHNLPSGAARPTQVPDGDLVVFCLTDTGCGMTPETLAQATAPLFSTPAAAHESGLGLQMVMNFARDAAGCLHLQSQSGIGTQASLYLPRCDDGGAPTAAAPSAAPATTSGKTALLVDDDDLTRPAVAAQLRAQGLRVVEADSAEMALILLPTLTQLALAAVSVTLPGMDGPALVQRLRQQRPGLQTALLTDTPMERSPLPDVPLLDKTASPAQWSL